MLIVGLTGGIASGKSTVARFMAQAGAHIIDADRIAREVVQPGLPAYDRIISLFGQTVIKADGTLNRPVLGELVFADIQLRRQLEAIVHPHVQQAMDAALQQIAVQNPHAVVVKDIPLLLEIGMDQGLAEIIVVYVPEPIQMERLMMRDGLSSEQALLRIRSQMPMGKKRGLATIVIDNSQDLVWTREQTAKVYDRLVLRETTLGLG